MYAIVRGDLAMTPGKAASQAGHAFLGAFLRNQDSALLSSYHQDFPQSPGTKVVLQAPDLTAIERAQEALNQCSLPYFLVVDSGCENLNDGHPTVTALGFGPIRKHEVPKALRRLRLL